MKEENNNNKPKRIGIHDEREKKRFSCCFSYFFLGGPNRKPKGRITHTHTLKNTHKHKKDKNFTSSIRLSHTERTHYHYHPYPIPHIHTHTKKNYKTKQTPYQKTEKREARTKCNCCNSNRCFTRHP